MKPTNTIHFTSPADFRYWLEENSAEAEELWVGFWKKGTGRPSITWEESVDEALCVGWIDGIRQRLDEESYAIRFTPRRRNSKWSDRNLERFSILRKEGRVRPAGQETFDRRGAGKARPYSYERRDPVELSPEFVERLSRHRVAWSDWQKRPPSYKKKISHWIMSAQQATTRERRLTKLIDDLNEGRG